MHISKDVKIDKEEMNINLQQAMFVKWHCLDGTHKLEEPVSKTTLNDCGGVPMLIGP